MSSKQHICTDVASRSRAQKSFVNVVALWESGVEVRDEQWSLDKPWLQSTITFRSHAAPDSMASSIGNFSIERGRVFRRRPASDSISSRYWLPSCRELRVYSCDKTLELSNRMRLLVPWPRGIDFCPVPACKSSSSRPKKTRSIISLNIDTCSLS